MPVLSSDAVQVHKALKDLALAWANTEKDWRDQARADFAEHHLNELEARARVATQVMDQMDLLLREAVHQCS